MLNNNRLLTRVNQKNMILPFNEFLIDINNENIKRPKIYLKTAASAFPFNANWDQAKSKFSRITRREKTKNSKLIDSNLLQRINRNLGENDDAMPGIQIQNIGDLPMFRFG